MDSKPAGAAPPATGARPALRTLIVDDEALARQRLRTLLGDCHTPAVLVVGEAEEGAAALQQIDDTPLDLVLLDIHMPGIDGVELARVLHRREVAPAVIFVTAHAAHAVTAFELDAVDYLTKPVRGERLQQALQKAERSLKERRSARGDAPPVESLLIHDRGRAERIPLSEVLYLRSEHKYITVRTATRSLILDGALSDLEARYVDRFVRVHRN
ncbi:MAG: response regulator transcription factor, partial [Comamonadaceae bacterium]